LKERMMGLIISDHLFNRAPKVYLSPECLMTMIWSCVFPPHSEQVLPDPVY